MFHFLNHDIVNIFNSHKGSDKLKSYKRKYVIDTLPSFLCARRNILSLHEFTDMCNLGSHSSHVFDMILRNMIKRDVGLHDIDETYFDYCIDNGLYPGVLGYEKFPKSLCISVNDVIAHGLPLSNVKLKDSDLVKLDVVFHKPKSVFLDIANTYMVDKSQCSGAARKLVSCTQEALETSILAIKPGARVSVIGDIFEKYASEHGFCVVNGLNSHFINTCLHSHLISNIPNRVNETFKLGMTLSLEPIFTLSKNRKIEKCQKGYAFRSVDGAPSAHFERTCVVTETGCKSLHIDL